MKLVSEIVETSASVHVDLDRVTPVIPEDVNFPEGGVNIRWPDHGIQQEERLYKYRLPAVLAYARANKINTVTWPCENARIGIAASGKGYLDTIEALRILGIEDETAQQLGLRVYQVGLIWPLEPQGIREFAKGLEELIVIEEKRQFLKHKLKMSFTHFLMTNVLVSLVKQLTAKVNGVPLLKKHHSLVTMSTSLNRLQKCWLLAS